MNITHQAVLSAQAMFSTAIAYVTKGIAGFKGDEMDTMCDPVHHMADLLHVMETQSIGGMQMMICGCIALYTNQAFYLSACGDQHSKDYINDINVMEELINLFPEHYANHDRNTLPFEVGTKSRLISGDDDAEKLLLDRIKWELFQDTVKDVKFDFEGGQDGH